MEGRTPAGSPPPMVADGKKKPPTSRLQKRAPAPIPISRETVFSCVPIPLLSPLVLSPELSVPLEDDSAVKGMREEGDEAGSGRSTAPPGEQQHPAVPTAAEASGLPSLFLAQCMVASHAE